ncbi:hypothetical protein B0H13DRAFT_1887132 [Mycena leptocephala]|nr:hypothetical protein B0H13DRAFT_1887132 [Mycena leptocephala]
MYKLNVNVTLRGFSLSLLPPSSIEFASLRVARVLRVGPAYPQVIVEFLFRAESSKSTTRSSQFHPRDNPNFYTVRCRDTQSVRGMADAASYPRTIGMRSGRRPVTPVSVHAHAREAVDDGPFLRVDPWAAAPTMSGASLVSSLEFVWLSALINPDGIESGEAGVPVLVMRKNCHSPLKEPSHTSSLRSIAGLRHIGSCEASSSHAHLGRQAGTVQAAWSCVQEICSNAERTNCKFTEANQTAKIPLIDEKTPRGEFCLLTYYESTGIHVPMCHIGRFGHGW